MCIAAIESGACEGASEGVRVEPTGIEPVTSCLQIGSPGKPPGQVYALEQGFLSWSVVA